MSRHYPDLASASDWLCRVGNLIQPIRSTTQICLVTRHQYGISPIVAQTSFRGETSGEDEMSTVFSGYTCGIIVTLKHYKMRDSNQLRYFSESGNEALK